MPARAKPINLLPQTEFELSATGRFLQWAVTSGRYIIIVTEIIVILAFLSRFKLDQDLANINNRIEGQKLVLQSQQQIERDFRLAQKRLEAADLMLNLQVNAEERFIKLIEALPPEIKLVTLSFVKDETSLRAQTLSEEAIGKFLARLKKQSYWNNLEMDSFSTKDGILIDFSLIMRR